MSSKTYVVPVFQRGFFHDYRVQHGSTHQYGGKDRIIVNKHMAYKATRRMYPTSGGFSLGKVSVRAA